MRHLKGVFQFIEKKPIVVLAGILFFIGWVYFPALHIFPMTDDYEWLNESYSGLSHPSQLFRLINGFSRPAIKLSYLLDYSFFGPSAVALAATTLSIHLMNLILLYAFLRRAFKKASPALAITLLYGITSWYDEVVLWTAARPDSVLLLFSLIALLILSGGMPSWRRDIALTLAIIGAAASKETWLLLPVLLLLYQILIGQRKVLLAIRDVGGPWLLFILYLGFPLINPAVTGTKGALSYISISVKGVVEKLCYILFRYFGFGESFKKETWQILLVFVLSVAIFLFAVKRKNRIAMWGMAWMGVTLSQALIITHLPSRYHYLPLVGFWTAVIAFIVFDGPYLLKKFRISHNLAVIPAAMAMVLFIIVQCGMIRLDIGDYHYYGEIHRALAKMAEKGSLLLDPRQPVLCINLGNRQGVNEFVNAIQGSRKLIFMRTHALWQVVFPGPLLNFARRNDAPIWFSVPSETIEKTLKCPVQTLLFSDQGFRLDPSGSWTKLVYEHFLAKKSLPKRAWLLRASTP